MTAEPVRPLPDSARGHDLIVVGASLGGIDALARLVAGLPPDLPASVLVVLHLSPLSGGYLPAMLAREGPLPVRAADDGAPLARGTVVVAVPDCHLTVADGRVALTRGPRENRWRPAVDVLFRSAAVTHGPHVVGVVLSGMLDDGAAGLAAIAACGGLTVVQEPSDAISREMPEHALEAVRADHVLPAGEMGPLLGELARRPAPPAPPVPPDLLREVELARRVGGGPAAMQALGTASPYSCPECGGPLWALGEAGDRHRCHLGHGYTARALEDALVESTEGALGAALRVMEERRHLLERMAARDRTAGRHRGAELLAGRADELAPHIDTLRRLLATGAAAARRDMPEPGDDRE